MDASDPHFTEFLRNGSEPAFTRLVERHMGLVHGTARRVLGNAREDALADVAQTVFSRLAAQARRLPADLVVSVWLHAQTRRAALNVIRTESRRMARERTAAELMQQNAPEDPVGVNAALMPHIDRALSELSKIDQRALALRYFEQCPFQEVGERLGLSPDAARKRLTRALETLRARLSRRGIMLSAAALTLWLTDESIRAAPASLTAATVSAALPAAAAAAAQGGSGGLLSLLTVMTGIKSMVIGAAIGLVSGGLWSGLAGNQPTGPDASAASGALPAGTPGINGGGAAAAQRFAVPEPATTPEGLLAQFREINEAPDTELNRLRLQAWLERIPADQWKPLVELADAQFTRQEKRRFPDLARQWAKADPEAAMSALLKTHETPPPWPGATIQTAGFGRSLAIDAYSVWYAEAPDKAGAWILKYQDDPRWAELVPGAIQVISVKLAASSPVSALRWAGQLQGDELRGAALAPIWAYLSREPGKTDWPDACDLLLTSTDREFGRMALKQAVSAWINVDFYEPGFAGAERWMANLSSPGDRQDIAELIVSNTMQPRSSFNFKDRPEKALAELLTLGPETASRKIARLISEAGPLQSGAAAWLLPLLRGPERDPAILDAARKMAEGNESLRISNYFASKPNASGALSWAVELSDPAVRDPMIRDLLARRLTELSVAGKSVAEAADWVEKTPLKPEVRDLLRSTLKEFESHRKP